MKTPELQSSLLRRVVSKFTGTVKTFLSTPSEGQLVGDLQSGEDTQGPTLTRRRFLGTALVSAVAFGRAMSHPASARAKERDLAETSELEREIEDEFGVKIYTMQEKFPPNHPIWQRDKTFVPYPQELTAKDLTDLQRDLRNSVDKKYFGPKDGQPLEIIASNRNSFLDQERNQLELCFIEGSPYGPRVNEAVLAHETVGHRWIPGIHYPENGGTPTSLWFDRTFKLFGLQPANDNYEQAKPGQDKIDQLQRLLEPFNQKVGLPPNLKVLSAEESVQYKLLKRLEYGYKARYPEELIAIADEIWFMGQENFEKLFTQVLDPEQYDAWLGFIKNDNFGGAEFATKPIDMIAYKTDSAGCCDDLAA